MFHCFRKYIFENDKPNTFWAFLNIKNRKWQTKRTLIFPNQNQNQPLAIIAIASRRNHRTSSTLLRLPPLTHLLKQSRYLAYIQDITFNISPTPHPNSRYHIYGDLNHNKKSHGWIKNHGHFIKQLQYWKPIKTTRVHFFREKKWEIETRTHQWQRKCENYREYILKICRDSEAKRSFNFVDQISKW